MLNVVAVMGRLARDPEMRQTTTGKNVVSFSIACDRGRKDANGQSQADWLNIVAWDKTAEFICRYFQKGQLIIIHRQGGNALFLRRKGVLGDISLHKLCGLFVL